MKRIDTSSVGLRRVATSVIGIAMAVGVSGALAVANQPSAAASRAQLVTICHKGQVIHVAPEAVPAHLAHGDTYGQCGYPSGSWTR